MKANATAKHEFGADESGVSPVVATLMLVLVAAGAAVGIGVFMNDFQETSTQDVSTPSDAGTLTIGGSSTVYEFSLAAIPEFEAFMKQRGTPVSVELEKGGSGAGRQAVGLCLVDIGSSSSPVKKSDFDSYPDCDGNGAKDFGVELKVHKVATDGVVFASLATNDACDDPATTSVTEVAALTEGQAYSLYYHNMDDFGNPLSGAVAPGSEDLDASANGGNADGDVTWDEIPSSGTGKCTHGTVAQGTDLVVIFDRKDPGGTSEIASEKLFGQKGQKQLESWIGELGEDNQGDGNQGVLDAVETHTDSADAIFFTSYGYAAANSLKIHEFGTTSPIAPTSSNIGDETYDATRPILYITAGEPTGFAKLWIDFVLNPHKNQLFAEAADFESVY